jgi:hypothetical protein
MRSVKSRLHSAPKAEGAPPGAIRPFLVVQGVEMRSPHSTYQYNSWNLILRHPSRLKGVADQPYLQPSLHERGSVRRRTTVWPMTKASHAACALYWRLRSICVSARCLAVSRSWYGEIGAVDPSVQIDAATRSARSLRLAANCAKAVLRSGSERPIKPSNGPLNTSRSVIRLRRRRVGRA